MKYTRYVNKNNVANDILKMLGRNTGQPYVLDGIAESLSIAVLPHVYKADACAPRQLRA